MRFSSAILILGFLVLAAPALRADVPVELGQKFVGVLDHPGDDDSIVFPVLAGEKISATVKGGQGLRPFAELEDAASGAPMATFAKESGFGSKTFKIKGFVAPATTVLRLRVRSADGSTGPFTVTTKGKLPSGLLELSFAATFQPGQVLLFPFDAKAGTKMTATVKPSAGSAAFPAVATLDAPQSVIDLAPYVKVKGSKVKVKKAPLTEHGTHQLAVQNVGGAGAITLSIHLDPPSPAKGTVGEPFESPGAIAGTVTAADIVVVPEQEPNDVAAQAQFVGSLFPGKLSRVLGSVGNGAAGPLDVDGYRFQVEGPQVVQLVLLHHVSVDFDIELYDGQTGEFLGALATDQEPEEGLLTVSLPPGTSALLDVVVYAWSGTGSYLLRLLSGPPGSGALSAGDGPTFALAPTTPATHTPDPTAGDRFYELAHEFVTGEVVVRLKDDAADRGAWAAARGMDIRLSSPAGPFVARLPEPRDLDAADDTLRRRTSIAAAALARDPSVAYAERNHVRRALATPNDTYYPLQWHYPLIGLPQAWDLTQGSASVTVAIIDTGIVAHPDLVARDSGMGFDFISIPQSSLDGDGYDPNPSDVGDQANQDGTSSWHGTHVAGTVGASSNDGQGVAGVDWNCRLMHLRVLGKFGGTDADIAEAIRYAARLSNGSFQLPAKRADVINMSLGGYSYSQNVADAVAAARAQGVVVVAAAGNDDTNQLSYPASYPGVISVSAVDLNKKKTSYSNFGTAIDVAAPGGDVQVDLNVDGYPDGVLSTLVNEAANAYSFDFYPGTSMASPHVAGVCALIRGVNPTLTPDQVEAILTSTASDLGAPGWDPIFGHGLIDAFAAVKAAAGPPAGGPKLSVSTTFLDFGPALTQLPLAIANTGGGTLTYTATDQEFVGSNWLSISPAGGTAPANTTVSVNRAALAPGVYTGRVQVASNGGSAQVDVRLEVLGGGGGALLDLGTIHVLAVDPAFFGTLGGAQTNASAGAYLLPSLPAGAWLVVAGPDLDGDGFICGLGEPCGLAPTIADPALIPVIAGLTTTGVDFVVGDAPTLPTTFGGAGAGLPPGGFPIATGDGGSSDG